MPDSSEFRPPDFPADGSDSVLPDAQAWVEHDDEQVDVNLRGINLARQALAGQVEVSENTSPTDSKDVVQPVLSEEVFPATPEKPKRKTGKVAFGGFVKPEMYDIFGDYDLESLTDDEKNWMSSEKLRTILFPEQSKRNGLVVDSLPLNQTEYNLIVRSPDSFSDFAKARSLNDKELSDDVIATSERASGHALNHKLTAMQEHHAKLVDNRMLLRILQKEAAAPGFAHYSEEDMKQFIGVAWNEFRGILDTVHIQRGWDDEQRTKAEASLINYLTQGSQQIRVAHWQGMIKLADNYMSARMVLFSNRIRSVSDRIEKLDQ
jgi:hypothetical protein